MNFLAYSTNVPADLAGKIGYGLGVTAIGVIIVFAVLILIMLVIYLFQGVFGQKSHSPKKPNPPKVKESPSPASSDVNQEELVAAIAAATAMAQEELIVVLAAAVAAHEGCDPASSRYRIRSFRRIL
ncbi:MAG: OadG family protein [Clostridia bacterium]|nr:OadG family protein [Clostridia bacterium]